MKILFITYNSIGQHYGGLQVQIYNTKKELEKLGHFVKLFNPWEDLIKDYDIIHFFSFMDTSTLTLMNEAKQCGKKIVMSTVYNEIIDQSKLKTQIALAKVCPTLSLEKYKQLQMIKNIDLFVFLSSVEERLFKSVYNIQNKDTVVVKNGVEDCYINIHNKVINKFVEETGINNFVLHVGQFTPNKNQLLLINAMKSLNIPLVMIGDKIDYNYYKKCKENLSDNMYILEPVKNGSDLLIDLYKAARLFVLPSIREAYPLTALEAGLFNTKILLTRNSLFDDNDLDVTYCNPCNSKEIQKWILKNYNNGISKSIIDKKKYTWEFQISILEKEYKNIL